MASPRAPLGQPTRGTTGTNRLRRVDRWIARHPALRSTPAPLVIDLGYGASGVTTFELAQRVVASTPGALVRGLEIDPARVTRANEQLERLRAAQTPFPADLPVSFARGGFEIPGAEPVSVIRAMNVLRQYDEADVADAWSRMAARLHPTGVLVEGTCDEIGRVVSWAAIGPDGRPRTLTISLRLQGLYSPSVVAERLPKALIHRNVPGERVHAFLAALEQEWVRQAPLATFSPSQRWIAAVSTLADQGWPLHERHRWRLGELTVAWSAVAPAGSAGF